MVGKNKTRIIYAARISQSCDLAFKTEVELTAKGGRQEPRSSLSCLEHPAHLGVPPCLQNGTGIMTTLLQQGLHAVA